MNYEFPVIEHIDQVLAAIEGHDEFIVAERDGYTVINYMLQDSKTFPAVYKCKKCDTNFPYGTKLNSNNCGSTKMIPCMGTLEYDERAAILRECRGITFYSDTGKPAIRKYQKFFNMGEKEETFLENVDFSKPHIILEKLDGSMVNPFFNVELLQWHTKMGNTDFAIPINNFALQKQNYINAAVWAYNEGLTLIFEWCAKSIEQRIVITHDKDDLILTAIRDNNNGEYFNYNHMIEIANDFDIPVVNAVEIDFAKDPQGCLDLIRDWEGKEGIVIRFDDGHMIKVKGSWYCKIHKNKDLISSERAVAELIMNNGLDDVKSFLLPDDLKMVNQYEDKFVKRIADYTDGIYTMAKYHTEHHDRKNFALNFAKFYPVASKALIFSVWDNPTKEKCEQEVMKVFKKNCNTNKNFNNLKEQLFSDLKYGIKVNDD